MEDKLENFLDKKTLGLQPSGLSSEYNTTDTCQVILPKHDQNQYSIIILTKPITIGGSSNFVLKQIKLTNLHKCTDTYHNQYIFI